MEEGHASASLPGAVELCCPDVVEDLYNEVERYSVKPQPGAVEPCPGVTEVLCLVEAVINNALDGAGQHCPNTFRLLRLRVVRTPGLSQRRDYAQHPLVTQTVKH